MGDAMIFTCPSGHRTFLGEPTGPRALPIVGAGELRHCLTCNAERRFEWKPEPSTFTLVDAVEEARAKNRATSERMAAIHMYQEAHWAEHGCTENDHDWTPHEGGRFCRRCRWWNAIITL